MKRPKLQVSDAVLESTRSYITRKSSTSPTEMCFYWAGIASGDNNFVSTLIVPKALETWGSFEISAKANSEVIAWVCAKGLRVFAQLHTHPGRFVEHSLGDELGAAFAYENFYSIVWPNYGLTALPVRRWGIHRYELGRFRMLRKTEIDSAIEIVPTSVTFRSL